MSTTAERDLAYFQANLAPSILVSAGNTVSGTLKADEASGEVRYRAGRDHSKIKAGDLAYLSRPHRENRVFRVERIEDTGEGRLFDVVGFMPLKS